MQNQLTPGQTNLQQSTSTLQQNNSALQNSGSPTSASDTSTVLNQAYPGSLSVTTQTTKADTPQTFLPKDTQYGWLFFPFLLAAVVVGLYIWSRLSKNPVHYDVVPEIEAESAKPAASTVPKKQKYQKKTTRKQRKRR